MNPPSPRLLIILLTFIAGTVAGSWAKPLGTGAMIVAGLVGTLAGYVGARWLMRRIF